MCANENIIKYNQISSTRYSFSFIADCCPPWKLINDEEVYVGNSNIGSQILNLMLLFLTCTSPSPSPSSISPYKGNRLQ